MKVRWLGEDSETVPGPSFTLWHGLKFRVGQWVEVTDEGMIQSARGNRFFEVEEKPDAQEAQATVKIPKEAGDYSWSTTVKDYPVKKKKHRRKIAIKDASTGDDAAELKTE